MGTTGLVAQALGARDENEVRAYLLRAIFLGFCAGLVIFLLRKPLIELGFWVSPASNEVEELAEKYFLIRVWSASCNRFIWGYRLVDSFRANQKRSYSSVFYERSKCHFGCLVRFGLNWGIEGVAIATAIAEVSALVVGLFLCFDLFKDQSWPKFKLFLTRSA